MPAGGLEQRRRELTADGYRTRLLLFPRSGPALHAMPTSCGVQRESGPGYDWDGLSRGKAEFAVFQWTISGAGLLTWEGRDLPVGPGRAMVVRIPHAHRYRVDPRAGHWEFLYVCLTGREALRLLRAVEDRSGPVLEVPADSGAMAAATSICRRAGAGELQSAFEASALAYDLVMGLLALGDRGGAKAVPPAARVTARAASYCRAHLGDALPVGLLARQCGLSRFHFARRFKAEHGMTPTAYVQYQRVRQASRLLRETTLPLKQIAAECGFADANYFGKVFRRQLGVTPGVLRRSGV